MRTRCLWPQGDKDVVVQARAAAASTAGAALAGEGTVMGVCPHGGRVVHAGLEKMQVSGVEPTVSIVSNFV
jgi:hypothetical protein